MCGDIRKHRVRQLRKMGRSRPTELVESILYDLESLYRGLEARADDSFYRGVWLGRVAGVPNK
mgnify:CR=1 FL=1